MLSRIRPSGILRIGASALALLIVLAAQTHPAQAVKASAPGGHPGCLLDEPCFVGRWEFVSGRHDGRFAGRSARSYTRGDSVGIAFNAERLEIFGVTGPTGGRAVVLVGDYPAIPLDFYSPVRRTHVLLFRSPPLGSTRHFGTLVVIGAHDPASRGTYVNVDRIQTF